MNCSGVLIESDWNLKYAAATVFAVVTAVLIEADWNLKFLTSYPIVTVVPCINRSRLEFKVKSSGALAKGDSRY